MKQLFFATAVLFSAILLSGCGTAADKGRQDYSLQMDEATIPDAAAPGTDRSDAALPYAALQKTDESRSAPPGAAPEAADSLSNVPLNDAVPVGPERVVSKNVRLGNENIGGMSESMLRTKLEGVARKTNIAPLDAGFNARTWAVSKEKAGKRLNSEKILKAALTAREGQKIQYSWSAVQPKITAAQMKGNIKLIAKFSTPFLDRSSSRIKNIRLTSRKIDHMIIMPGKEFSFNKSTGSKSKKHGYEDATVIVKTPEGPKHKKAPGGGVCQISTTIYNAVMKCGLKVTERHEHSDDVYYVPDGKDATVTYRGADFRFVNTRSKPIMLRVYVGKRYLQVRIYENSAIPGT